VFEDLSKPSSVPSLRISQKFTSIDSKILKEMNMTSCGICLSVGSTQIQFASVCSFDINNIDSAAD